MQTLNKLIGTGKSNSIFSKTLIVLTLFATLFAVSCSEPVYYSVLFESNGGTTVPAQSVQEGKTVTKPTDPTREGYTFAGWYSDFTLTQAYDFSAPVKNNLVLYAKWSTPAPPPKTTHTVDFQSLGGSDVEDQEVEDGKCAVEPEDPTRRGYIFFGWYTELPHQNQYDFSTPVTSDLTLYAKWVKKSKKTVSVTYLPGDGATGDPIVVNITPGAYTLKYNTPEGTSLKALGDDYTNYTKGTDSFLQWDIGGKNYYDGVEIEVDDDIVASATWLTASNIGSFDSDGNFAVDGTSEITVPRVITKEKNKLVESVKAGSFTGSVLDLPPSVKVIPDNAFKSCSNLKSVYFNTEEPPVVGGNAFSSETKFYIPKTASKSEYADALDVPVDKIETVDYSADYFTVSFNSNGGSSVSSQVILKGSTATRPANPSMQGYTFDGWFSNAALTSPYDFSTPVISDILLYAKWISAVPTYNISVFSGGHGTVSGTTFTYSSSTSEQSVPLTTTFIFENGYVFDKYTTNKGSITVGADKKWKTLTIPANTTGDITVTANFIIDNFLRFTPSSGTAVNVKPSSGWNGDNSPIRQYSTDNGHSWIDVTYTNASPDKVTGTTDVPIRLRGLNCTTASFGNFGKWSIEGSAVSVSGNIMTILDYTKDYSNPDNLILYDGTNGKPDNKSCFKNMFLDCTVLTDASELQLPATTLVASCYHSMFQTCKALKKAPNLPATGLADNCYNSMFLDCYSDNGTSSDPTDDTGLTTTPELPAETMKNSCYYNMFKGCKKLTSTSEIKATALANSCFYYMFYDCSSLKVAEGTPSEPAKKIFTCPNTDGLTNPVASMFSNTGGSFTSGTPTKGNTYYWYT